MGTPIHYSVEIPQRCLQLIEQLWPEVERTRQLDAPHLGPLSTTFLISMSMPIINLPIERIERRRSNEAGAYADDRHIDAEVSAAVDRELGGQAFSTARFYREGEWRFVTTSRSPLPNLANALPDEIVDQLESDEAASAASKMSTSQWCGILRNALAHGGIAYLDVYGRSSYGSPVAMLLFGSGRYDRETGELVGVNLLRIKQSDYRAFLHRWVAWLSDSGLSALFAAA